LQSERGRDEGARRSSLENFRERRSALTANLPQKRNPRQRHGMAILLFRTDKADTRSLNRDNQRRVSFQTGSTTDIRACKGGAARETEGCNQRELCARQPCSTRMSGQLVPLESIHTLSTLSNTIHGLSGHTTSSVSLTVFDGRCS